MISFGLVLFIPYVIPILLNVICNLRGIYGHAKESTSWESSSVEAILSFPLIRFTWKSIFVREKFILLRIISNITRSIIIFGLHQNKNNIYYNKIFLYINKIYLQPIRNIAFVTSGKNHNVKIFGLAVGKLHTVLMETFYSWEHLTNVQQTQ